MATVTFAPVALAAYAIAAAAFPALIVTMPFARCFSGRLASANTAPRGLNEPVRWKSSALRYAVAPIRSPRVRLVSIGVRWR